MDIDADLELLLKLELVALAAAAAALALVDPPEAASYRLFELFGALLAASITTFGLLKMDELT